MIWRYGISDEHIISSVMNVPWIVQVSYWDCSFVRNDRKFWKLKKLLQSCGKSQNVGFEIKSNPYKIPSNQIKITLKHVQIKSNLSHKSNIWNLIYKSSYQITLTDNTSKCINNNWNFFFRTSFLPDLGFYYNTGTLQALRSLSCKQSMYQGRYSNALYCWTNQSYCWTMQFFKFQIESHFSSNQIQINVTVVKSNQQITQTTRNWFDANIWFGKYLSLVICATALFLWS